ncbi:hypothetical protein Pmani_013244 [Petrolisthes manimaculis]|uniref:Uncharacterized protein n=1 Tax=Petrolisthes manimaculis TaxID=1843537 RepID=A0AAE1PW51_9EUCA|nr:hypothetical protein Pmani_013244 [Petrolisthes manimaculis]
MTTYTNSEATYEPQHVTANIVTPPIPAAILGGLPPAQQHQPPIPQIQHALTPYYITLSHHTTSTLYRTFNYTMLSHHNPTNTFLTTTLPSYLIITLPSTRLLHLNQRFLLHNN